MEVRSKPSTSGSLEVVVRGTNLQHWGSPGTEAAHAWDETVRGKWVQTCTEPSIIAPRSAMPDIGWGRQTMNLGIRMICSISKYILPWTSTNQQTRLRVNFLVFSSGGKKTKAKLPDTILRGSQLYCHFQAPKSPLPHLSTLHYAIPTLTSAQLLSN